MSSSLGNSYRSVQAQSVMAVQADFPPVWVIIMKNKAKIWGFLIDPEQKLTLKAKNQVCLPESPTQQVCFTCPPCSRPQTRAPAGGAESSMGQVYKKILSSPPSPSLGVCCFLIRTSSHEPVGPAVGTKVSVDWYHSRRSNRKGRQKHKRDTMKKGKNNWSCLAQRTRLISVEASNTQRAFLR